METLQTRTEFSRSIEDAEKYKAIQILTELGALIPIDELETYHGRIGAIGEDEWAVNPAFRNGGNDSGNLNTNNRPSLYTGERTVATSFAEARLAERGANADKFRAEVHDITTDDTDATVLDLGFDDTKLDAQDKARYSQALKALLIPITVGSPIDFEARDQVRPFTEAITGINQFVIRDDQVSGIAVKANIDKHTSLQLASALNARQLMSLRPSYLASKLLEHDKDIYVDTVTIGDKKEEVPVNLEYVQRYMREAHIVGVKQNISSATLGRTVVSVSFFDLDKTITTKGLEAKRNATSRRLGDIATTIEGLPDIDGGQQGESLLRALGNAHVKPATLVAAAQEVENYGKIFGSKAGNWEGFTLAEHTETVLRNFDENYADKLPVELLAPMRLALIAHDLGKPEAAAKKVKIQQKAYNVDQASDFFDKIGVDDRMKVLLLAIIGEGATLAYKIDLHRAGWDVEDQLYDLAADTLRDVNNGEDASEGQIKGFIEMCKILQICDGGAYTSMATTARSGGNGRYRNAPSYNASFAAPVGFGKRDLRLRKPGEAAAPRDLTPHEVEPASRLRISHSGAGRKQPHL